MASDTKQRVTFLNGPRGAKTDSAPSSPCSPEPISIRQARQTADRLYEIEQDLTRRISEQFGSDRQLRSLLAELRICSSRVREQINDCAARCKCKDSSDRSAMMCEHRMKR